MSGPLGMSADSGLEETAPSISNKRTVGLASATVRAGPKASSGEIWVAYPNPQKTVAVKPGAGVQLLPEEFVYPR